MRNESPTCWAKANRMKTTFERTTMMKNKLAPQLIELTQDACLKSFWRKPALRAFLLQHHISQAIIATWHEDETKRVFLQRLFSELILLKDNKGHAVILSMARSLAEMSYFPDLEGWEDSAEKKCSAHISISRLKSEVDKLNEQIRDERESACRRKEAAQKREENIASILTLEKLRADLNELVPKQGTQAGGYAFEQWFYKLVNYFEVTARPPYKTDGRQIDGALDLDGTTFLIETKFTANPSDAPDIDIFISKVTQKADNTMGIFVSISGFTKVAIEQASRDRTPILLLDYSHIYNLILSGAMTLPDTIRRVKRHASQTGKALLSVQNFSG